MRRAAWIAAACAFAVQSAADDAPLRIRNLAPVAGIYAMPRALGGDVLTTGYELSFNTEIANNFTSDVSGDTLAFFDGETLRLTYGYRRSLGERWEWGVEIPYVIQHGGNTDRLIDGFHTLFGTDDDGRNRADRDQIDYYLADDGITYVDFQSDRQDWGDISLSGGYQLLQTPQRSLAVRGLLKLPTGDADKLTGSGAADAALWLDYTDRAWLARFNTAVTLAGGLSVLGNGDVVPDAQERVAGYAHAGVTYTWTQQWSFKAQLDFQSRLIDTPLEQVSGASLQGAVGARWRYNEKFFTDVGLAEDLTSDSTSDLLFQLLMAVRL